MASGNFQRRIWRASQTTPDDERPTVADARSTQERSQAADEQRAGLQIPLLYLIVSHPAERRGTILHIKPDEILGRSGNVRWEDALVSRQHARFVLLSDKQKELHQYAVEPYQDRNGTYVNGKRIAGLTPLHENDTIGIGDTQFTVKVLD